MESAEMEEITAEMKEIITENYTMCNQCSVNVAQMKYKFSEQMKLMQSIFESKRIAPNQTVSSVYSDLFIYIKSILTDIDDIKTETEENGVPQSADEDYMFHEFVDIKSEPSPATNNEWQNESNSDEPAVDAICLDAHESDADDGKVKIDRNVKTCKECNIQVTGRRQLVNHMVKEHGAEKPYKCERCPKEFSYKYSLKQHSQTLHRNKMEKKVFICDICSKTLTTNTGLIIHRRIHTGEKPYECDICSNSYMQKPSLMLHMKTHSDDRPLLCHTCSKTFKHRSSLRLHLQTHSGIKPFKCTLCERGFLQKSKLVVHMQSHTGERPVLCPICSKGYTKRYHVKKHLRNFHKVENVDAVFAPGSRGGNRGIKSEAEMIVTNVFAS